MKGVRTVVLALAVIGVLAPSLATPVQGEEPQIYAVWGRDVASFATQGELLTTYDSFELLRLTAERAAEATANGYTLETLRFGVSRGGRSVDGEIPEALTANGPTAFQIVRFIGPLKQDWLRSMEAAGATPLEYLPNFAFLTRVSSAPGDLETLPFVAGVVPYHPAFKLAADLPTEGILNLTVVAHPGVSRDALVESVRLAGYRVLREVSLDSRVVLTIDGPAADVVHLATLEEVNWIEPAALLLSTDAGQAAAIVESGHVASTPITNRSITGDSQIVMVCDDGLDEIADTVSYPGRTVLTFTHELFDDTATPTRKVEYNAAYQSSPLSLSPHRKVVAYYVPPGSGGDLTSGARHGSAVVGTFVGDSPPYGARNATDGVAFG